MIIADMSIGNRLNICADSPACFDIAFIRIVRTMKWKKVSDFLLLYFI